MSLDVQLDSSRLICNWDTNKEISDTKVSVQLKLSRTQFANTYLRTSLMTFGTPRQNKDIKGSQNAEMGQDLMKISHLRKLFPNCDFPLPLLGRIEVVLPSHLKSNLRHFHGSTQRAHA